MKNENGFFEIWLEDQYMDFTKERKNYFRFNNFCIGFNFETGMARFLM